MKTLNDHIARDGFRLRGTAMSRIDGFSDVVFGFALTLLVVSLEAPKTFQQLHEMVGGFVPFAISFLFLLMIWFAHFQFFRRFGLEDLTTIVLNSALLFVVLFYVYPLKFLFSLMTGDFLQSAHMAHITDAQTRELMILYSGGFAAIYLLLAALYWNAWRQRKQLELNPLERALTKGYTLDMAAESAVGLLACALALLLAPERAGLSGFTYFLIAVTKTLAGTYMGRQGRRARAQMERERVLGTEEQIQPANIEG